MVWVKLPQPLYTVCQSGPIQGPCYMVKISREMTYWMYRYVQVGDEGTYSLSMTSISLGLSPTMYGYWRRTN